MEKRFAAIRSIFQHVQYAQTAAIQAAKPEIASGNFALDNKIGSTVELTFAQGEDKVLKSTEKAHWRIEKSQGGAIFMPENLRLFVMSCSMHRRQTIVQQWSACNCKI